MNTETKDRIKCWGWFDDVDKLMSDTRGKCPRCDYVGRMYWKGIDGFCHVGRHYVVKLEASDD